MAKSPAGSQLDPSRLPGHHRDRVFIGGSYADKSRSMLKRLAQVVHNRNFHPIIADDYQLQIPGRDVHDTTLCLLHSCRLAIFELSRLSGALIEIERTVDYGTQCLILFADPEIRGIEGWRVSRMLSSFVEEREAQLSWIAYRRPRDMVNHADQWLRNIGKISYDH